MPSEPVKTKMGAMDAYLIEARSIGGLSGSPVFVYLDPIRMGGSPGTVLVSDRDGPIGGKWFRLGLIHGHYDMQAIDDLGKPDGLKDEAINMGIAIVVPFSRVLETINKPERAVMRKKAEKEMKNKRLPTQDVATPPMDKEEFENILKKVSRRTEPSPPDQETKGT
jgi:hypothetical protein